MPSKKRTFEDAAITKRRVQPDWLRECMRAGVPHYRYPTPPSVDASHKEKCQYTWALRALYRQHTGKTIERLTLPGHGKPYVKVENPDWSFTVRGPDDKPLPLYRRQKVAK